VLPALKALFLANSAAEQGRGSRAAVREADAALGVALATLGELLRRLGPAVAGGMAQRLQADVDHMRRRMAFQDAREVVRWCELMAAELRAFQGRMALMLDAAVDAEGLDAMVAELGKRTFSLRLREATALGQGSGEPAAWLVVARRS
jgi:hypothetical protein